jgi:hypothetical protein
MTSGITFRVSRLLSGYLNLCLFNHWGVYFSINKNLRFHISLVAFFVFFVVDCTQFQQLLFMPIFSFFHSYYTLLDGLENE